MFLQIYFQNGEFFLSGGDSFLLELFISAFGAFIGILGAMWLYRKQTSKQQTDLLKYISSLLESVISYTKTQSVGCKTLYEKLLVDPMDLQLLEFPANNNLKRLVGKVDQQTVYHAYLEKYKREENSYKSFQTLYVYLDYIDLSIAELKSILEKEYTGITQRKKNYAESLDLGLEKCAMLTINPNIQNQQQLLQFINSSIGNFYTNQIDVKDITYTLNNFTIPVKNFLAHNFQNIPECNDIVSTLKKATNQYSGIELQVLSFIEKLKEFENSLKEKAESLENHSRALRKDYSI